MKTPVKTTLLFLLGLFVWSSFGSALVAEPRTPKPGTAERTAILDTVRAPLEAEINQKAQFVVNHMKVENAWAFLIATPQTKAGRPIDYSGTQFEADAEEADELTVALLRKKDGAWVIERMSYFTTDVWWSNLWEDFNGCPRAIFPR